MWGPSLKGKHIVCNVDNESVCTVINRGHSRDPELQDGMREVAYIAAINNFELFMVHIPGRKNLIPDLLSRWGEGPRIHKRFRKLIEGKDYTQIDMDETFCEYTHQW